MGKRVVSLSDELIRVHQLKVVCDGIIRATARLPLFLLVHVRRKLSLQEIVVRVILICLRLANFHKRLAASKVGWSVLAATAERATIFPAPGHEGRLRQCED